MAHRRPDDNPNQSKWYMLLKNAKTPGPGGFLAVCKQRKFYKVHSSLRRLKPGCFENTTISLGLFHLYKGGGNRSDFPSRLGDTLRMDVVNTFMVEKSNAFKWHNILAKFLGDLGNEINASKWQGIAAALVKNPADMRSLYHGYWVNELTDDDVRSALALDAIFVASLLEYFFNPDWKRRTSEIFKAAGGTTCELLLRDISNLENQIPLSLIREVIVDRNASNQNQGPAGGPASGSADAVFNRICYDLIRFWLRSFPHFQPLPPVGRAFDERNPDEQGNEQEIRLKADETGRNETIGITGLNFGNCDHLLHCLAQAIWVEPTATTSDSAQSVEMSSLGNGLGKPPNTPPRHLPTAQELHRHGIKFEGLKGSMPRFERHRWLPWIAVLYLPTIDIIDNDTEQLWRNFLAFEVARVSENYNFRLYLGLMDQLVNTEEDVLLLCKRRKPLMRARADAVIGWHGLGDNKMVATLFNTILANHYVPRDHEWDALRDEIMDFHHHVFWRWIAKFAAFYSDVPWLFASAFVLLVLTFIQTLYTVLAFNSTNNSGSSGNPG